MLLALCSEVKVKIERYDIVEKDIVQQQQTQTRRKSKLFNNIEAFL